MTKTQITFTRNGKPMTHSFGRPVTVTEARDWFRRSILESVAGWRVGCSRATFSGWLNRTIIANFQVLNSAD